MSWWLGSILLFIAAFFIQLIIGWQFLGYDLLSGSIGVVLGIGLTKGLDAWRGRD